MGDLDLLVI